MAWIYLLVFHFYVAHLNKPLGISIKWIYSCNLFVLPKSFTKSKELNVMKLWLRLCQADASPKCICYLLFVKDRVFGLCLTYWVLIYIRRREIPCFTTVQKINGTYWRDCSCITAIFVISNETIWLIKTLNVSQTHIAGFWHIRLLKTYKVA